MQGQIVRSQASVFHGQRANCAGNAQPLGPAEAVSYSTSWGENDSKTIRHTTGQL